MRFLPLGCVESRRLRGSFLDGALTAPPLNCPGVGALHAKVNEACNACHRDFRG